MPSMIFVEYTSGSLSWAPTNAPAVAGAGVVGVVCGAGVVSPVGRIKSNTCLRAWTRANTGPKDNPFRHLQIHVLQGRPDILYLLSQKQMCKVLELSEWGSVLGVPAGSSCSLILLYSFTVTHPHISPEGTHTYPGTQSSRDTIYCAPEPSRDHAMPSSTQTWGLEALLSSNPSHKESAAHHHMHDIRSHQVRVVATGTHSSTYARKQQVNPHRTLSDKRQSNVLGVVGAAVVGAVVGASAGAGVVTGAVV